MRLPPIHNKKKQLSYFYSVSSCSVFRQTADFSLVETAAGESFSFFLFPSFPLSIGSAITKRLSLQISRGEEGHCLATQLYHCTICDFRNFKLNFRSDKTSKNTSTNEFGEHCYFINKIELLHMNMATVKGQYFEKSNPFWLFLEQVPTPST